MTVAVLQKNCMQKKMIFFIIQWSLIKIIGIMVTVVVIIIILTTNHRNMDGKVQTHQWFSEFTFNYTAISNYKLKQTKQFKKKKKTKNAKSTNKFALVFVYATWLSLC